MAKQKKTKIALLVGLILACGALAGVLTWNRPTDAAPSPTVSQADLKANSIFHLASVDGWWQGATNHTSMAAYQNEDHNCFVSAAYFPEAQLANREAKRQKATESLATEGHKINKLGSKTMELSSTSGPIKYNLDQQSISSPTGSTQVKGGQEFGFIDLADGQIEIEGYCDSAEQLPLTIPALDAINFNPSKL